MKLRMKITKDQEICFLSHLEYMKTIERAIKRAKLPVMHSEGFNPHMKFSLASALGVGISSTAEYCELEIENDIDAIEVVKNLENAFPQGIRILQFEVIDYKTPKLMASVQAATYIVQLKTTAEQQDAANLLAKYNDLAVLQYEKQLPKNKGSKIVDIKYFVFGLQIDMQSDKMSLEFSCKITNEGSLKAAEIVQALIEFWQLEVDPDSMEILRTDLYKFDEEGKRVELLNC